jgi:hypothetical protein
MGQSEVVKMLSAKRRMMSIMSKTPPVPLGCHERRSGAQKKIATPRHILDRIGNQPSACNRLRQSAHRRISL